MAKARKAPDAFFEKDGDVLLATPNFLYERQTFINFRNRYSLDDTVSVPSKEPLTKLEVYSPDKQQRQHFTLVGAPMKWLSEKGYTICKQTP